MAPQKIQKLLPPLKEEEDEYIPKVASIGPYFYNLTELGLVQQFKRTAVELFVEGNHRHYYSKIEDIIAEIRNCYDDGLQFTDDELTNMMLEDACLIIIYMEVYTWWRSPNLPENDKFSMMKEQLGMVTVALLIRDLFLFQNQIPLRVIKLLMNEKYVYYGSAKFDESLNKFLPRVLSPYEKNPKLPSGLDEEPFHLLKAFHLLEAFHMLFVFDFKGTPDQNPCCAIRLLRFLRCKKVDEEDEAEIHTQNSFRTATDLRAKGIHFKPSDNKHKKVNKVEFKSYFFFATLRLPSRAITTHTKVLLKNMVAYELMPHSRTQGEVMSYISLMKTLIDGPEDLKVLREKRIVSNAISSDEKAAKMYNDITTYGNDDSTIFLYVKRQIQEHCHNRTNTWTAELFDCYFRSPWSTMAFFAALCVLVISVAQLHYAIYPPPN